MLIIFLTHKCEVMIYTPFDKIIMRQNPEIEASKIKKSIMEKFKSFVEQENQKLHSIFYFLYQYYILIPFLIQQHLKF